MKKLLKNLLFLLILVFFLCLPLKIFALSVGGTGILPANSDPNDPRTRSWFILTMNPGEEKEDAVNIFNNSEDEVVVKVYAVDGMTTSDGGFTLVGETDPQSDIGAWLRLYGSVATGTAIEVGLKSHEIKKVPFIITLPDNAYVGDHMGGIIIQEVSRGPAGSKKEGMSMSIITRIGVRIYLTVPGERVESLSLTNYNFIFVSQAKKFFEKLFNLNYHTEFLLDLKNDGNTRIEPTVKINIKNIFGQSVDQIEGSIGMVFPKKSTTLHLRWDKPLFLGRYTAAATVYFGDNKSTQPQTLVIYAAPYRIIITLAVLLALFILFRLITLYIIELSKEKMLIYVLPKKETIQELAEKFKVNWSRLARLNKIKQPYELTKGQKLFIPKNRRNQELLEVLKAKGILEPSIQEKLGKAPTSIFYKIHHGKKSIKILLIALIILAVGAGATWLLISLNSRQKIVQSPLEVTQPTNSNDEARTKGGELKRSELKIAVYNAASTTDNVDKLIKKLDFVGFPVEKTYSRSGSSYSTTTFEIKPDGMEAGEAVRTALGLKREDIEFKEVEDLEYDVLIAYFVGEIFDLELPALTAGDLRIVAPDNGATSTGQLVSKSQISLIVLNGGAVAGSAGQVANTLKQAGYTQVTSANADVFTYQGITIYYQTNYSQTANEIKQLLNEDYPNIAVTEKADLTTNIEIILGV